MKHLILLIGLSLNFHSFTQQPVAAIESLEVKILYRGYANKVIPAVTNNGGREITIESSNATIESVENRDYFIVKPSSGKYCQLDIVLISANGDTEVIKTVEYRVSNLPDPYIYWGEFKSGGDGNIKKQCLSVKYPFGVQLENEFSIVSWETSFENDTISGEGSSLYSAQDFFKKIPSGTTLNFRVKTLGPDGITRSKHGQWTVMAWEIEKDLNQKEYNCY